MNGKAFKPGTQLMYYIFLIALAIFIFGVQVGIKHGRALELEDIRIKYGYFITD